MKRISIRMSSLAPILGGLACLFAGAPRLALAADEEIPLIDATPAVTPESTPSPVPQAAEANGVPAWVSRVELSGLAALFYRYELTKGAEDFSTFDLGRMYFRADVKPMDHVKFRMTLDSPNREATTTVSNDVTTVASNSGKFDVVLKHAYAELYDVLTPGLSFKFGMHDLPWVPMQESMWTYRFQGSMFEDREGYVSSTDFGMGTSYVHPSKTVETHLSIINGESWQKPEVSKHKDVHARVTLRPISSLPLAINVFGSAGQYDTGDDLARQRFIPQIAFEHNRALLALEYFWAKDPPGRMVSRQPSLANSTEAEVIAAGVAAMAWLDLALVGGPEGVRVMARVEQLDPDDTADNSHTREIVGIGYRTGKYVEVLLDGEAVQYQDAALVANDEKRVFLHTRIGF